MIDSYYDLYHNIQIVEVMKNKSNDDKNYSDIVESNDLYDNLALIDFEGENPLFI